MILDACPQAPPPRPLRGALSSSAPAELLFLKRPLFALTSRGQRALTLGRPLQGSLFCPVPALWSLSPCPSIGLERSL